MQVNDLANRVTKKRKLELEQSPALNDTTSMPLADDRLNLVRN